jgi:hypothetical protein
LGIKITRRQRARDEGVTVRTVERRQATDPNYPKSEIINGRHYFDADECAEYDRRRAGAAQVRRPAPAPARKRQAAKTAEQSEPRAPDREAAHD